MPYHTPDDDTTLTGEEVIAHMIGQIGYVVYCNCAVTLVHRIVHQEALLESVNLDDMENGRCEQCHGLVRIGAVNKFIVAGPTMALHITSQTREAME